MSDNSKIVLAHLKMLFASVETLSQRSMMPISRQLRRIVGVQGVAVLTVIFSHSLG